jgi:dTMP kinase
MVMQDIVSGSTKAPRRRPARLPIVLEPEDRRTLDEVARAHVRAVLIACHGNQTNAARTLGMDRKTLARRLSKWGMSVAPVPTTVARGSLIALEGLDGAGITTQAVRLVDYLNARGHPAILTGEPTTGDIGLLIRRRLAETAGPADPGTVRTLSLLFAADRIEHFHRVVAPALAAGTTVVSDRWYHSSLAYQRTSVERDWIMALYRHTRTPEVTVFLDVRPDVGQQRRAAAGLAREMFHDAATQREVHGGYRITISELRSAGERIETIDAEPSVDAVFSSMLGILGLERRRRPR